jgi:hypothetical protein
MSSYRDPAFHERLAASADARKKALDRLKAKPALDPAIIAERQAAEAARQAALAEKSAEKKRLAEEAKLAKAAAAAEREAAALAAKPAPKPELTEAEKKAERDRRYAARKGRK